MSSEHPRGAVSVGTNSRFPVCRTDCFTAQEYSFSVSVKYYFALKCKGECFAEVIAGSLGFDDFLSFGDAVADRVFVDKELFGCFFVLVAVLVANQHRFIELGIVSVVIFDQGADDILIKVLQLRRSRQEHEQPHSS